MASWEVRDGSVLETPTKRLGMPVPPMLSPEHDAALLRTLAAVMEDSPSGASPPSYQQAIASMPTAHAGPQDAPLAGKSVNEIAQKKTHPAEPLPRRTGGLHAVVEFKLGRRARVSCPPELEGRLAPSTYVIVEMEGAKVIDTAMCVGLVQPTRNSRHALPDVGAIVRVATMSDCDVVNTRLPALEQRAMTECQRLIHFLHLPFVCVDTEYSFDGSQVRVYYVLAPQHSTTVIPNLSRLQRELSFSLKARVVLEQRRPTAQQQQKR